MSYWLSTGVSQRRESHNWVPNWVPIHVHVALRSGTVLKICTESLQICTSQGCMHMSTRRRDVCCLKGKVPDDIHVCPLCTVLVLLAGPSCLLSPGSRLRSHPRPNARPRRRSRRSRARRVVLGFFGWDFDARALRKTMHGLSRSGPHPCRSRHPARRVCGRQPPRSCSVSSVTRLPARIAPTRHRDPIYSPITKGQARRDPTKQPSSAVCTWKG